MNSIPIHFNSDRVGRIVMLAMEEILGQNEVDVVRDLARLPEYRDEISAPNSELKFSFDRIGPIQTDLEHAYGSRAGRGLSLRVGRACLKYSLREFGSALGVTDLPFRLLPLPTRLRVGCEALTGLFNQASDQHVSFELDQRFINFHVERCPLCGDRQIKTPRCALMVGFLQEALSWASGGKYFLVKEKNCIAYGDTKCTIEIDQIAMS